MTPDTVKLKSGRGPAGHYAKGNGGGPGRPTKVTEEQYLKTLRGMCPLDVWQSICERLVEMAQSGDHKAIGFLGKYLLPPVQTALPLIPDDGEIVVRWKGSEIGGL